MLDVSRRRIPSQKLLEKSFEHYKTHTGPLKIQGNEFNAIVNELETIVSAKRMSEEDKDLLLELFESPSFEDDDYAYEEGGGKRRKKGRRSRRTRHNTLKRKSCKSCKSRKIIRKRNRSRSNKKK